MSAERRRASSGAALAGIRIGAGASVVVMGVLNVSPESFYGRSVHTVDDELQRSAAAMVEAGAALLDVGAMSTAPYLTTAVSESEECQRLEGAIRRIVATVGVPISADTTRPRAARIALDAGARVINDVSGLGDPAMAEVVAERGVSAVLMASPAALGSQTPHGSSEPVRTIAACFDLILERARHAGVGDDRIVLDPGIGFFLADPDARADWDARVLAGLPALRACGRPLCVGVSRKSFIGHVTGRRRVDDRLPGSLAATAIAVMGGAAVIRTHDVAETVDAVRIAERIRSAGGAEPSAVEIDGRRSTIEKPATRQGSTSGEWR